VPITMQCIAIAQPIGILAHGHIDTLLFPAAKIGIFNE